jgi:hypothetical protein
MSQQLQITGGAKVRSLEGVITGSTGVLGSLPINASNGIPQLDVNGKILVSQLPNSVMEYKGTWNAATNTPTLADGTGNQGDVYLCNVAGTVNFGSGPISFVVGDQVIYSGTIWQKASGATGTVTSVAVTESGDALTITGSPITTSGTINIGFAGTGAQYVAGDGSLVTFPTTIAQAQRLITEVYNSTGATLTKGTVVYINGGQGNLPTVTKALATGDSTSAQTYGVVQSDITNMNNGYVVVIGSLNDIDTQAYAAGTQLYLSPTTAGAWTSVKQYAPAHLVYVGIVVRSHPTQGVVEIRIQNGFELDELHNVSAQTPTNNQGIFYNSSTSLWENKSIATALGYTPISLTSLSATSPLSYNNTTGVFSISQASGSTSGFLSSTDWTTFNNKQNALTNPITGTGASGQIAYFNGTTTQTSSANLTWDNTDSILSTKSILATTDVAAYNLTINNEDFGKIQNVTDRSWSLAYSSGGSANALGNSALVWNYLGNVIVINKLSVGNYNTTYNLDITGTARFTGQLTLGSTITNGTNTYTLPSATGTLALSSDLTSYVPTSRTLTINGTTYDLSADRSWTISAGISGSGTTNYVPKFTSGTAIGNSLIFDNGTNVGIGTATPFAIAGVNLSLDNTTDSSIQLGVAGTRTGQLYASASQFRISAVTNIPMLFYTNDTERMRITSTGNVGIGTTSPTGKLSLYDTADLWINIARGTSFVNIGVDSTGTFYNTNSNHRWLYNSGSNEGMRLTSGGLLLIGTTSSSGVDRVRVNNDGTTSYSTVNITNANSTANMYVGVGGSNVANGNLRNNAYVWNAAASDLLLGTSDVERMKITSTGLVGIGTSSPTSFASNTLQINGATSSSIKVTNTSGGTGNNDGLDILQSIVDTYIWNRSDGFISLATANAERMRITSGGDVCINATTSGGYKFYVNGTASFGSVFVGSLGTGTVYSSSGTLTNTNPSDKRLKENITPITYGLNEILKLNPVSFDWKNDNNKNKQFGFIAQEVQEVMPEAVIEGEYLGLEKDAIYTALINAIKELKAEIDELKNK